MNKKILLTLKRILFKLIGVLLIIAVWQYFADSFAQKGMEMLLASPFQVINRLKTLIKEPDFWTIIKDSCTRIFSGFFVAFVAGIVLGSLSGEFQFIEDLLWPSVATVKAVPVASFVVILFIWFTNGITPILTFLIAFPLIYGNVLQGVKGADTKLIEVADVYKVSFFKRILYIKVPNVAGYLTSASSTAIGMAWKAGVAAELILQMNGSIGEKLYYAKMYLVNEDLIVWTLIVILLSVIFEKAFVLILKFLFGRFYRI